MERQAAARVGLLLEKGLREMSELKSDDEAHADAEELVSFVDGHVAVNILASTESTPSSRATCAPS